MHESYEPSTGLFEARYVSFLETVGHLRPRLHRYCARMVGSVLDGEDIVQEALFHAYRNLESFDDTKSLAPWLFRIAHNQCIDFLRRRGVRRAAEVVAAPPESVPPAEPTGPDVSLAVEHLVLRLPPKERACVLLKDVFDYSLDEIATLVGSTVGGVKSALKRGRTKLSLVPTDPKRLGPACSPETARLRDLYIERFNCRDWDGVRDLIAADAQVRVADRYAGPVKGAPYFGRYDRVTTPWRLAPGEVDGEPVLLVLERGTDAWTAHAIVRLDFSTDGIVRIVDYTHCPWVLSAASSVEPGDSPAAARIAAQAGRV